MSETTKHELTPLVPKRGVTEWAKVIESERPTARRGRILQVFMNANLRSGHDGLEKLAKDNGIKVRSLEPGQFVVFINTHKDKVKVFAASQVIAYCRLEKGRKIDMNVIREIPRVFLSNGRLDYEAALKEAVEQALARKGAQLTKEEGNPNDTVKNGSR